MRDRLLLVLLGVIVLTTLLSPFQRELFVGDETKYSRVIYEMRESGSLLVMKLHGEPYTHKPPLHFWVMLALTYVFGFQSLWPFVLQSLLGYVALIWIAGKLAGELFVEKAVWPSRLAMASCLLIWGLAQTARMDITFVVLIAVAALQIARFFRTAESRPLYLAALAVAVAILVKGPMAFVMVALMMLFERFRRKSAPAGVGRYVAAMGIVLAGPLLWLIPSIMQGGREYANELLVKQNVGRALNAWVHKEPFWYYIAHAPADFYPWFFLAVIAVVAWYKRRVTSGGGVGFCLSWIASVVVPFSLLSSKLDVYMTPVCIPVALITGWFISAEMDDRYTAWGNRANRIALAVVSVLTAVVAVVPLLIPRLCASADASLQRLAAEAGTCTASTFVPGPELALTGSRIPLVFGLASFVAFIAFVVAMRGSGPAALRRGSLALVVGGLAPVILLSAFLMRPVSELSSTAPLVRALAATQVEPAKIALYYLPHVWTRDMSPAMANVQYVGKDVLKGDANNLPAVIATRRDKIGELGPNLSRYKLIATLRMIGKDFDVYARQ